MSKVSGQSFERKREEVRRQVLERDRGRCQWPGCIWSGKVEVLFIVQTDRNIRKVKQFDNGILVCKKHTELVFLDELLFAPFLADLIKLVEFERNIEQIEKYVQKIARQKLKM